MRSLLLLTTYFCISSAQGPPGDWDFPYFTSLVEGKVNVGEYLEDARDQDVTMWEEMSTPIRILQINYKGTDIQIDFQSSHLGANLNNTDGKWYIVINNRLDFEQTGQRLSLLRLKVEQNVQQTINVIINLINILDNAPSMSSEEACTIPELKDNFLSECSFIGHHDDGFELNQIEGQYTNKLQFVMPTVDNTFKMEWIENVNLFERRYKLRVIQALDYAQRAVYNFPVTVYDLNQTHNFTMNVVVTVQNVDSRDPIFIRPFTTQRITEKTPFCTIVTAIDGDTGLDAPICYELETTEAKYAEYFSITLDESGKNGKIEVQPVNRDKEKNEFYQFKVTAYKCHNRSMSIVSEAAIILEDLNDNEPKFDVSPTALEFWENTLMELDFEKFNIEDIDLGPHATYIVELQEKVSGELMETKSFSIIPRNGYQLTSFTLTIINVAQLDYELPDRRQFDLIVRATEDANKTHTNEQVIAINLLNWNDEVPAFGKESYEITIEETIGAGVDLLTLAITDRDVDDSVELKVLSRIGNNLTVSTVDTSSQSFPEPTFMFTLTTANDNLFDWDVAKEVVVQLEAKDTLQTAKEEPLHQVFAQVVITVLDINNKPPSITVPRERIHIVENSEPNTAVQNNGTNEDAILIGTDPDSDAQLQFSIDWANSYAVKTGVPVKPEVFENCLIIEADSTDRNRVTARILVNPALNQTIINERLDYEKYETLFLSVRLVDENQVVPPGDTEATVVIQIGNVNDNPPNFVGDTLTVDRYVLEEASAGTIVGSIAAWDADGDEISYTISATNPDHEGLISIASTGMLTATEKSIDCDVPATYVIPLDITLSDGVFNTTGSIEIKITDTNNKVPTFIEKISSEVEIFEKSESGTEVLELSVKDLDRDYPFHAVQFEMDFNTFPELRSFFEVKQLDSTDPLNQKGLVQVRSNNDVLDRDTGTARFTINVRGRDNPSGIGRQNTDEFSFTLVLLDINDHAPKMPELTELQLTEDAAQGAVIVARFEAPDLDDRSTPNAKINYRIMEIKAAGDNAPEAVDTVNQQQHDQDSEALFTLAQLDEYATRLSVGRDLKTFYGRWTVQIEACDRGDEYDRVPESPRRCSNSTYTVRVEPVNYMAPKIEFPGDDERIRLKFESLTNGQPLVDTQGNTIQNFRATDTDGGSFGVVTFSLQSQDDASQDHLYFQLTTLDQHTARLELANAAEIRARSYRVIVLAVDGGGRSAEPVSVVIAFINMTGEPEFQPEDSPWDTDFTENEEGMEEERTIPEAIDPKNAELPPGEHSNVFYFIDASYGDSSHLFQLDKESRILRLTQELDREEIASHEIRIIATNNANGPTGPLAPDSRSQLLVRIKVNDVNDNPPTFLQSSYSAGITSIDYPGKILFQVVAEDPDEDDVIRYSIDESTLEVFGENLPTSPFPFGMNSVSGELSLGVQIQDSMKGHFTFMIVAKDLVDHSDTVQAKIYLIAESNRVKFVFLNNLDDINTPEMREFLKTEFSTHYDMECNIDDVVRGTIDEARAGDGVTDVRAHFIKNDEAVEAVVIQQRSNDRVFVTNLKTALSSRQLFLQDVPVTSIAAQEEQSGLLQTVLIVVAAALGILCVILLVAFCIKIRSLNRQLKAMSATDFVSIASDMNIGAGGRKVPTTNVFSVEGSNPVLNDREFTKGAYDDVSVQSYESDFIGIDNDLFAKTQEKDDELNPALMEHIRQRSLNPMVNSNGGDTGDTLKPEPPARRPMDNDDELTHRF